MAIQSFEIDINGTIETIEFEDDMPFGKFEQIIMKTANIQDDNLLDNVQKYRKEIMLNSIKKAPFPITVDGLNEVGYKVITEIGNKILDAYPLGEYLNQMMSPFNDSVPVKK
jgi:hypothetical protein